MPKRSSDCPQQRYATGEPGKIHGQNENGVGILEASCGYRVRGVSIRGKFVLLRNLRYEEDRHVSKRSPDLLQRYVTGEPGKVQGRDCVGIVESSCGCWARGIIIRGKFVLSRNLGYKTRGSPHG